MPPASPAREPRLEALTGLRFVAALLVVVHHFGRGPAAALGPAAERVAAYGYVGVSFFFVLSGFILAYVYAPAAGRVAWRAFYAARFARVYPLYGAALVLAAPGFVFRVLTEVPPPDQLPVGVATAVTAPLLLQAWTPWTALLWNTPGWSLSVEAFLYLLTPAALVVVTRWTGRGMAVGGAALWLLALVGPALYLAWAGGGEPMAGPAALWHHTVLYAPPLHVPQFALGLVVGAAYARRGATRPAPRGSAGALLGALALGLALVPGIPQPLLNDGLIAPAFALLFWALAPGDAASARFLASAPLRRLGDASYAVYLLQKPVYQYAYAAAEALGVAAPHASSLFFGGYLVLLVGVSLLAHRGLEVPARRWIRVRLGAGPGVTAGFT